MKIRIEDIIALRDGLTQLEKPIADISNFSLADASRETNAAFNTAVHLYSDQEMRFFRCADNFIHITNQPLAERGMLFATEFMYTFSQEKSEDIGERPQGWKFHVRVDDSNPDDHNLERSWPIMLDKLKEHHVAHAKVIRDDHRDQLRKHPEQNYKTYTIYAYADPRSPEEWLPVIADIESALLAADIIPSALPAGEALGGRELVANSQFFSCRDDRLDRDQTISASDYVSTNPYHDFDIGPLLAKKQSTATTSISSSATVDMRTASTSASASSETKSNKDAAPERPQLRRTHAEEQLHGKSNSSHTSNVESSTSQHEKPQQNDTEAPSSNLAKRMKIKLKNIINGSSKSSNNENAVPEEDTTRNKVH